MKKFSKRDSNTPLESSMKKRFLEVDLEENLLVDSGERKQISC